MLFFEKAKRSLERLTQSYVFKDPKRMIFEQQQHIDELRSAITHLSIIRLEKEKTRLAALDGKMHAFNPLNVLRRGYSILVEKKSNKIITAPDIDEGTAVKALLEKGSIDLIVTGKSAQ